MTEEYLKRLKEAKNNLISRYQCIREGMCENSKELADEIMNLVLIVIESYDIGENEFNPNFIDIAAEGMEKIVGNPQTIEYVIEDEGTIDEHGCIRARYMIDPEKSFQEEEIVFAGLPDFRTKYYPVDFEVLKEILRENKISIAGYPDEEDNCLEIWFDVSILKNINAREIEKNARQKLLSFDKPKKGNK